MLFFDVEKVALQDRLGGVLGRSWDVFGAVLGGKNNEILLVLPLFFKNQRFGRQERPESRLGPNLGQLGPPKGPKWDPKRHQKRSKK